MTIKKWSPLLCCLLFLLLVLVSAQAGAITLGELELTNGTITVGDKLFSNFATNAPFIEVDGRTFGDNAGLNFTSMPDFGPDFSATTNISFTVTALDPLFRISGFNSAVGGLPEGTGTVGITDMALDLGTNNVLGSGFIFTTGLPISETLPILNSVALSTQVKALRFERTVDLTGPLAGGDGLGLNMSVSQTPIPEPSTVVLFGAGLAGLGLWRWKKIGAK